MYGSVIQKEAAAPIIPKRRSGRKVTKKIFESRAKQEGHILVQSVTVTLSDFPFRAICREAIKFLDLVPGPEQTKQLSGNLISESRGIFKVERIER